jgi:hypothetical protein
MLRRASLAAVGLVALACAGCGTTEKEGSVGDELTAEGLEVTVDRVDRSSPEPRSDITGLSKPGRGRRLVGVHVRACSEWGTALKQFDFSVEASGATAKPKLPTKNYRDAFEPIRDGCGDGWLVFEVPADSKPERVRFEFTDTGRPGQGGDDGVEAELSWDVE